MSFSPARAGLFGRYFAGDQYPVRPPWAAPEDLFVELCTGCGDCIRACSSRLLQQHRGGYPQVRFERSECNFCGDCARACKTGALARAANQRPWQVMATITTSCLTTRGVVCRTCGEQCEYDAILFRHEKPGIARPRLETKSCTGCGACFAACPVHAIVMTDHTILSEVSA